MFNKLTNSFKLFIKSWYFTNFLILFFVIIIIFIIIIILIFFRCYKFIFTKRLTLLKQVIVIKFFTTVIMEKAFRLEFLSLFLGLNNTTKLRAAASAGKINMALFTTWNKLKRSWLQSIAIMNTFIYFI